MDAEARAIVDRAREARDLHLAAVAGPGVDVADGERAAEDPARRRIDGASQDQGLVGSGRRGGKRLGRESGPHDLREQGGHALPSETERIIAPGLARRNAY